MVRTGRGTAHKHSILEEGCDSPELCGGPSRHKFHPSQLERSSGSTAVGVSISAKLSGLVTSSAGRCGDTSGLFGSPVVKQTTGAAVTSSTACGWRFCCYTMWICVDCVSDPHSPWASHYRARVNTEAKETVVLNATMSAGDGKQVHAIRHEDTHNTGHNSHCVRRPTLLFL